jgi:acetylornithine deacetylase/succinyl-diaminopimelate desuccinylase-like protein
VLPREATFKISCRLVPGQDPARVGAAVRRHLEAHCPPGVTLEVDGPGAGAPAYRVAHDHWAVRAAAGTLERVFGTAPALVGMGGSVPITATFRDALAADTVFFSFSTGDEDIHAPNEFYRPQRFRLGLEAWARLWRALAGTWRKA